MPTPSKGSKQTKLHPGIGAMSAPTGNVPALTNQRQGILADTKPSRYNELAGPPPPAVIADIDPANWYSPFQPIAPFGPPGVRYPRTFDYRTGINLDYAPAIFQKFEQLQVMSRSWGLLRSVIETRKDQLMRLPWAFQVRGAPKKQSKWVDKLTEFFRKPDGKTRYQRWKRLYLEDLFVIDAPTIYKWKAVDGTPLALQVLNGATIKPLIDDVGRIPDYPSPAYQQIIKGLPMTNFDETELMYAPMRPTPQLPIFGYSPCEQVMVEILVGIRRLIYQTEFWQAGSMPELIITVPDGWTPQQTAMFQAHFDALMSGNTQYKSQVRFVPGGMKPFDIKNANGEALKADVDVWWARLICFTFSISCTPFVETNNRATAETAQETAEEEGLLPLMSWDKDEIMDPLVQEDFGYDEIEFNYLPNPEVDQDKQATRLTALVKEGIITRNEGREDLGRDPIDGGDELTMDTLNGPVPIKETVEANRQMALNKPNELDNQQESHDQQIASAKAQAKQPKPRPGKSKGVGKAAAIPFGKAIEAEQPRADSEQLAAYRKKLEDAAAAMLEEVAPQIAEQVAEIVAESVAEGETPDPEAVAETVAERLDLSGFESVVDKAEEVLTDAGADAGGDIAAKVRLQVGDDYGQLVNQVFDEALDYARERSAEMVGMTRTTSGDLITNPNAEMAITDTTRARIKELVVQALEPGEEGFDLKGALEDLKDAITDSPLFNRTRAALIAQAEVGMASGNGSLIALEALALKGFKISKKWSTSHDERVCLEDCMPNELVGWISLNSIFPSGDMAPLAHPRCRCALISRIEEPSVTTEGGSE